MDNVLNIPSSNIYKNVVGEEHQQRRKIYKKLLVKNTNNGENVLNIPSSNIYKNVVGEEHQQRRNIYKKRCW